MNFLTFLPSHFLTPIYRNRVPTSARSPDVLRRAQDDHSASMKSSH